MLRIGEERKPELGCVFREEMLNLINLLMYNYVFERQLMDRGRRSFAVIGFVFTLQLAIVQSV